MLSSCKTSSMNMHYRYMRLDVQLTTNQLLLASRVEHTISEVMDCEYSKFSGWRNFLPRCRKNYMCTSSAENSSGESKASFAKYLLLVVKVVRTQPAVRQGRTERCCVHLDQAGQLQGRAPCNHLSSPQPTFHSYAPGLGSVSHVVRILEWPQSSTCARG